MGGAFVAGATGYTGRELVRVFSEAGLPVAAHVRPDSSSLERWRKTFEAQGAALDTTPWHAEAMLKTLQALRPEWVFACLGTTRKRAGAQGLDAADAYERIDFGLTRLLIDACVAAGINPRFVYLSSLGATEQTGNAYLKARGKAEAHLIKSGLPYTLIRPSFITGTDREEDRPAERVGAVVVDGLLSVVGALGGKRLADAYSSMTGAQLASAMMSAARDPACAGQVLEAQDLRSRI